MNKKTCIVYTHHKLGDLIWQLPYIKAISEHHNDKVDLNRLKDFIVDWESKGDFKSKTIIVPEFFDRPVNFIWYDIIPREVSDNNFIQYSRFQWRYSEPKSGILDGLDEYIKTFKFTIADRLPRKQKRNDDENSNHR